MTNTSRSAALPKAAPQLAAMIERRLLINYRLDPEVAAGLLPDGLRPQLLNGSSLAGVCLLRMGSMRPASIPQGIGFRAENAAHRIAVEWDTPNGTRSGVYIPIRHSASWLPVLAGGRLFPGRHAHASFSVSETRERMHVSLSAPNLAVDATIAIDSPSSPIEWTSSLFASIDEASDFFQKGSVGWSPSLNGKKLEGMRLETDQWSVGPARAESVSSSFFDSLPRGSARLDNVLIMRKIPVLWHREKKLSTGPKQVLNPR